MERKSIEEHLLNGNFRPDKAAHQPSHCSGGRPRYPRHLSKAGRAEFKRMVQFLEARGVCTAQDFHALALCSEIAARWVSIKNAIGEEWTITTLIKDTNGVPHEVTRVNPLLKELGATEARFLSILKTLGLSPTDRDKAKPVLPAQPEGPQPGTAAYLLAEYERTHPDGMDTPAN
jgi:P27 family predicted phage terminase small subunit